MRDGRIKFKQIPPIRKEAVIYICSQKGKHKTVFMPLKSIKQEEFKKLYPQD